MIRRLWLLLSLVTQSVAAAQLPTYRTRHDVIRGTVASDSSRAIAAADVAITMAPERVTKFTRTDSSGAYAITFDNGTGDYLVHVAAVGYRTFRKRVTRSNDDSIFVVDAVLQREAQQLAAVKVEAKRKKPDRDQGIAMGPGTGAVEMSPGGVNAIVAPDERGNLDALASTLPGVSAVGGGGISVLGLPPASNETTLNGLAFSGATIPRGARTSISVATSTYDATRGGFSGAQIPVTLAPAGLFISRGATATLDAPQLQAPDAVARRAGMPFTSIDMSASTTGEVKYNRWFLNSAIEAKHRTSDATSLLNADESVLRHAGVSPDSIDRFLSILAAAGVPATTSNVPRSVATDAVSFIGRLDRPMFDYNTYTPLNTTWGLTAYAGYTRNAAVNLAPTATPAHSGESRRVDLALQGLYSAYFGANKDELNETRSGVTLRQTSSSPYVRLPDGSVLVTSSLDDSTAALTSLAFGGNAAFDAENTSATWETTNETSFYWAGRAAHPGKVYVESRFDAFRQNPQSNRFGQFAFNSLEDLAANRPAYFTRTLDTPTRTGGEWSGAAAAVDKWTPTSTFQLLYGARVEGNAFTAAPAFNPQIESLFGARTNRVPSTWGVSPRLGFTWRYTSLRGGGEGESFSQLGQFYRAPRGALRGGIGAFRNRLEPTLISDAIAATGLPGAATQLSCIGSAAPPPEWDAYVRDAGAIPTQCLGGPGAYSDIAPNVHLFDPAYQPLTAWRGNLSWTSGFHRLAFSVDAIYSYNTHQPGVYDLNFADSSRFRLSDEGGRPVYVDPASIVPTTGALSTVAARRNAAFGEVLSRRSDLHGWARQLTFSLRPDQLFYGAKFVTTLWYTFSQGKTQTRGFDASTFGDPTAMSWSRNDYLPTHEFVAQLGYGNSWASATLFGKVSSGLPFTPMVASDINGDGMTNDRAFIFDPAATADTALGRQMKSLLDTSPPAVRACLDRQRDRPAERNSCVGPWRAELNAAVYMGNSLKQKLHIPRTATIALNLANPLSGLDQLFHGNNLRGWGTPGYPSPYLYYVRGFDSTTRQFRYEVNPRFGDTRPSATSIRAPFRLTLDISLNLSPNIDEQVINRWLEPGRHGNPGPKLDSAALMKRYQWTVPDWYEEIIEQADSLLLSREQVEALRAARAAYIARMDAHWAAVASYMASLPDDYDAADALKHETEAQDQAWEMARQEAHLRLPELLTPIQLRLLPGNAGMLFRADKPLRGVRYTRG